MDSTSKPYTVESYRRNDSVGYLINGVRALVIARMDTRLAELGVTGSQWGTMMSLVQGGARTAAEVSRQLGCDTGAMTRMLDRLEEKGLVRRERSVEDRRVVHVLPTESGVDMVRQAMPSVVDTLNELLAGFSPEEIGLLKDFLRRMQANLGVPHD